MTPEHPQGDAATPDDRAEHLRVWESLPWVVNGQATPEQACLVANHLGHCEDCRAELALQQRLRSALVANEDEPQESVDSGLLRLLERIDEATQAQATVPPPWASRRMTQALVAAVLVQAVGLGVLGLDRWRAGSGDAYRTLAEARSVQGRWLVVPDATMTLAQWQALLQAQGLQVAGGPNAAGAYTLGPAAGAASQPAAATLSRLRALPQLRLAEPLAGAP